MNGWKVMAVLQGPAPQGFDRQLGDEFTGSHHTTASPVKTATRSHEAGGPSLRNRRRGT